jgi:hypothetical protein
MDTNFLDADYADYTENFDVVNKRSLGRIYIMKQTRASHGVKEL